MVNINCSLNCFYQYEGKCTLKEIPSNQIYTHSSDNDCIYYINQQDNLQKNIK